MSGKKRLSAEQRAENKKRGQRDWKANRAATESVAEKAARTARERGQKRRSMMAPERREKKRAQDRLRYAQKQKEQPGSIYKKTPTDKLRLLQEKYRRRIHQIGAELLLREIWPEATSPSPPE